MNKICPPVVWHPSISLGEGAFISLKKGAAFVTAVESLAIEAGQRSPIVALDAPFTADDFKIAHHPEHVDDVLSTREPNGFGSRSREIATQVCHSSASLHQSARLALRTGVACSPTSGFHHAGWDYSSAYCTFNGLALTLIKLKAAGLIDTAAILDLDAHYGDGTDDIIKRLKLDWIDNYTHGRHFRQNARETLSRIPKYLSKRPYDIVLYQAGADSHASDPYGAGYFSNDDYRRRDEIVFETCRNLNIPIAFLLAGGYSTLARVTALHVGTYRAAVTTYGGVLAPSLAELI